MDAQSSANERLRGPLQSLSVGARRIMFLVIVGAISFLALWLYAKQRVHEEIRRYVQSKLARHYAERGLSVSVGSARLIEGRAIEIRDVWIVDEASGGAAEPVAHVDEILVACNARLQDLIARSLRVQRVAIRHLELHARRDSRGGWNVERLLPLPTFSDRPPPIRIENGAVELLHCEADPEAAIRLHAIQATVTPRYPAEVAGGDSPGERSAAAGQPLLDFEGTLAGDWVERVRFQGVVDPATRSCAVEGSADDVRVSPQLFRQLPAEIAEHLALLATLRGRLALAFRVAHEPDAEPPLRFSISGTLAHGQIDDPRLPYPLTEISAEVQCDNQGLRIDHMTARSGLGTIQLACRRDGFCDDSPMRLTATAKQLVLDERLAAGFPEELGELWDTLSPSGTVDVDLTLTFDGHAWRPDLTIECLDVSFAHRDFPYRVRGCLGTIHWTTDVCTLDLHGLVSGRVARFEGELSSPGPNYTGWIDITLDGPVTLNEEILSALKPKPQQVVRSFHPQGTITFQGRLTRKDPRQTKLDEQFTIELLDCSVKYDKFPYPIERIRGTLEMSNGQWIFQRLEGYNDNGYIVCDGSLTRQPDGGQQLELTFTATSVPLEDELRAALKPSAQQLWDQLRPRGMVDQIKIVFRKSTDQLEPLVDVWAQKKPPQGRDDERRSITVHPVWFPYQLDEVQGTLHFRNGQVTLDDVRARHGNARMTLNGNCLLLPQGWKVSLRRLTADHLRPDRELISALPGGLGAAMAKLNLTGLLTMQGSLELVGSAQPGQPVRANWDLDFDVEQGDLHCGIQLNDLCGGVHLIGDSTEHGFRSRGEVAIDSVIYNEIQLTNVKGPIWIDGFRVALGRWARPAGTAEPLTPVTARLFGGQLAGDAQVALTGDSRFDLRGALKGADLAQLARSLASTANKVSGKIDAALTLTGSRQGTHTWRGGGRVRLYDADIYEVPVMLALLKILSVQRPDTTAFDTSQMDFRIHGSHIYFDRIDFTGDAISLRGNGEMSLDRRINLNFYTIVGRNEFLVPLVSPILGLASREILQIHVDGTLDHPNPPVSEVLPGLNETLRQLFPELDTRQPGQRRALLPGRLMQRRNLPLPQR